MTGDVTPASAAPIASGEETPESDDTELLPWEEPATPEEQAALEPAVKEAARVIYEDDAGHGGVMSMLGGADSPVDGVIRAVSTIVTQIDQKLNLPVAAIGALTHEVFNMVSDVATNSGKFQMSDQDLKLALAGTQEAVMKAYGMEESELEGLAEGLSDKDVRDLKSTYEDVTGGQGFAA